MPRKNRWKILALALALVGLPLVIVAAYFLINREGEQEWVAAQAELRAKKEPMEFADVAPPPIPDAENFAMSPIFEGVFGKDFPVTPAKVRERLKTYALPRSADFPPPRLSTVRMGQPTDLVAWQDYVRHKPGFTLKTPPGEPARDVLDALAPWGTQYAELAREVRQRPAFRAPISYDTEIRPQTYVIYALLDMANFLAVRTVAAARAGEFAIVREDVQTLLLLRGAAAPSQSLTNNLMGSVVGSYLVTAIREGLTVGAWDDAQLEQLSAQLEQLHPFAELRQALRVDRVNTLFAARQATSDQLILDDPTMKSVVKFLPRGIFDSDRATFVLFDQDLIEKAIDPAQGRLDLAALHAVDDQVIELRLSQWKYLHILTVTALPGISGSIKSAGGNVVNLNEARVAIALERWRRAHGTLPETLGALVPGLLKTVPVDPFDGQPLRYKRMSETSYIIWSVGPDGKDDGGQVREKIEDPGDWVWLSLPSVKTGR